MFLSLGASTSPPCSQHPLLLFQAFPPGPALPLKNTTRTGQDPPSSCLDTFIDTTKPCWFSLGQADNSAFCISISSWLLWANTQSQAISLTASWDIKWNSLPLKLECSHLFWKPSRYLWDTILLAIWASIWWIIFDIVLSLNIPMFWIQFSWMFPANVQIITFYPHTKLLCSLTPFWPVQLFFFFGELEIWSILFHIPSEDCYKEYFPISMWQHVSFHWNTSWIASCFHNSCLSWPLPILIISCIQQDADPFFGRAVAPALTGNTLVLQGNSFVPSSV